MSVNQYHQILRKIVSGFSGLFNNIIVIREDSNRKELQRFKVPIIYANKEKYTKRIEGDYDLNKKVQIVLPVMSYEMTYVRYDPTRKLNTVGKNFSNNPSSDDSVYMQFNPVPYDIGFSLSIYVRNEDDGHQILEYILPFFTPDWNLRLNLIPSMGTVKTIPVTLNSVEPLYESTGPHDSPARVIIWTLNFNVSAFLFGAIKDANIIKYVEEDFIFESYDASNTLGCSGLTSKTYNVYANGHGNFITGEIVYQGLNLENSYAAGKVYDWDANNNILSINNIAGKFRTNQTVIGSDSLSVYVIEKQYPNTVITLQKTTSVYPNTANISSNWTANVEFLEYPDTL
jgi:hypothetical protein